jgi:COG4 transport protein
MPGSSSSNGSGNTGEAEDAHPHITALAAVLGGASACMAALQRVEACHSTTASTVNTTAGATTAGAADAATGTAAQTLTGAAAAALHSDAAAAAVSVLGWFVADAALQQWQQRAQAAASNTDSTAAAASSSGNSSSSSKLSPKGGVTLAPPDPQAMDFLVDELSFACQLCQRYLDFCADEMHLDSTTATAAPAAAADTTSSSSSSSSIAALVVQLQVLVGAYVQLEDAYCLLNVKEALRIAEPIEVSYCL